VWWEVWNSVEGVDRNWESLREVLGATRRKFL
jgi:hypothetical protein